MGQLKNLEQIQRICGLNVVLIKDNNIIWAI